MFGAYSPDEMTRPPFASSSVPFSVTCFYLFAQSWYCENNLHAAISPFWVLYNCYSHVQCVIQLICFGGMPTTHDWSINAIYMIIYIWLYDTIHATMIGKYHCWS